MFRIAICDDEKTVCTNLEKTLMQITEKNSIEVDIELFYSGEHLYNCLSEDTFFDLIFMDIEMPGKNGIEISAKIRDELYDEATQIVFISGKRGYERKLFDGTPLGFLDKPLTEHDVKGMLFKAIKKSEIINENFTYVKKTDLYRIPRKSIVYFQSHGRQTTIFYLDKNGHFVKDSFYEKLSRVENRINSEQFLKIRNSCLINYLYVREYHYEYFVLKNISEQFEISRTKRKMVRDKIMCIESGSLL